MLKERQAVESNFKGMDAMFIEPVVDHQATSYIESHIDEIRKQVRKMGIDFDLADDLINDVWLSLIEAENNGNGYDVSHSNDGDIITVEEFVYGRIKGYSMNSKYRSDVSERHYSKDSSKSIEVISASAGDASDLDTMDGFQKAYALAASYDDIENVEAELSLRSNIEFCLSFNDSVGFNMINFFRNMEMISSISFNSGLFDGLKRTMKLHEAFKDAFREVMVVAANSKPVFEAVLSTM